MSIFFKHRMTDDHTLLGVITQVPGNDMPIKVRFMDCFMNYSDEFTVSANFLLNHCTLIGGNMSTDYLFFDQPPKRNRLSS